MKTQHTLSEGGVSVAAARGGNTVTPFAIHNSRFTIQTKRSTVMKSTSIFRIVAAVVLAVFLVAGQVLAQGILMNGGTYTNTGNSNFKKVQNYLGTNAGTINNSGNLNVTGGPNPDLINSNGTQNGTVYNFIGSTPGTITVERDYTNSSGITDNDGAGVNALIKVGRNLTNSGGTFSTAVGTIEYNGTATAQDVLATTYGGLKVTATGTKTLLGNATVNTLFEVSAGTLDVGSNTLTIKTATLTTGGSLTSAATGTVVYDRNGNQEVFPAAYGNLTFAGTGSITKSVKGTGGNVSIASTLTNPLNNTFDVGSNNLTFGASAIVSDATNAGTVKVAGIVTFSMADANIGGTFEYSSTADGQNVAVGSTSTQYKNLTLSGDASKSFAAQEYKVSGNFTVNGSTTANFATGSTLHYNGSSAQTVAPLNYKLLKFSEAGTKTLSGTASAQAASNTSVAVDVLSANSPTFVIANGAALTVNLGRFQNASTVNINGNGSLTLTDGNLLNQTGAQLNVNAAAGSITVTGDLENSGTITNAGTITVQ
jgi:fibronectin-binding autotransporter adhesin